MKTRSLTFLLGLSLATLPSIASAQTGQWNVNNNTTWFNSTNWLNNSAPSGAGTTAIINHDIGSTARFLADFVQNITVSGVLTTQTFTLSAVPVNGTLGIVDSAAGFFWSQGRGSNTTNWTVTYDSGLNQLSITYAAAANFSSGTRTINVGYGTTTAATFTDFAGITELVGQTNGSTLTFSKVLAQSPDTAALAVTDGVFFWKQGVGSSSPNFSVSFNAGTRTITATYTSAAFAGAGKRIIAAYFPLGVSGSYSVDTNTTASGAPITLTRVLATIPLEDSNFKLSDGSFTWTNGTSSSPANFGVVYNSGTRTAVATYKTASALTTIGSGKTLTATYTAASAAAKNVTLGNLFIGDINSDTRQDLRLNSLTFDNNGKISQLNSIIGVGTEIASNITLNNALTVAVRTGGDSFGQNTNSFQISGNITGTGSLTKIDSGNWTIAGTNTYTGDTIIRTTGGITYLENTTGGNAISSNRIILGNANRDGHAAFALNLGASNQIADTSKIIFDAASGRNSYIRMIGFSDTVGGIYDTTGQGVIENTESEAGISGNSILTVNNNQESLFNGFFRNKSSGASSGTIGLVKAGSAELTLTGGNISYSGPTTVNGGLLRLQNVTGSGNLPFNPLSVTDTSDGGAYNGNNAPRFRSDIANSGVVDLAATTNWTFGSVISGSGALSKSGASTTFITNNNTFNGITTIEEGTLQVYSGLTGFVQDANTDFTQAIDNNPGPNGINRNIGVYGHGRLSNTAAIALSGGTLRIENGQTRTMLAPGTTTPVNIDYNETDRVNNAATISSTGGGVTFAHAFVNKYAAESFSETLGTLNLLSGRTNITTSKAEVGQTSTLTFAGLTRSPTAAAVVNFFGNELGDNARNRIVFTSVPTLANGIIGGWATIRTDTPDGGTGTIREDDFATYDNTTQSVRALQNYFIPPVNGSNDWGVDMRTNTTGALNLLVQNSPVNVRYSLTPTGDSNPPITVNSIKFGGSSGRTLSLAVSGQSAHNMIVGAGGILSRGANHTITNGSLTAGNAAGSYDLNFWVGEAVTRQLQVNSSIVDNAGNAVRVVKSGPGRLRLVSSVNGGATGYSGGTTIYEGNLYIDDTANLGRKPISGGGVQPDYLTFDGGALVVNLTPTGGTAGNRTITFDPEQGITLGNGGGTFSLPRLSGASSAQVTAIVNSVISGPGGLLVDAADGAQDGGTLILNGLNTFTGNLVASTGATLVINGGTNNFRSMTVQNSGSLIINDGSAVPANRPLNIAAGDFTLADDVAISSLTGAGRVLASATATGPVHLTINQDNNTTFSGLFRDGTTGSNPIPAIGFTKTGNGVLTMTNQSAGAGDFRGAVNILGGVLVANTLSQRGSPSAIGTGLYDSAVVNGTGLLTVNKSSASNLKIADGAALSYAGDTSALTNRSFTLGSGPLGASVLSNSGIAASVVRWVQNPLLSYSPYDISNPLELLNCSTTAGSPTVTCLSTAELLVGMVVDESGDLHVPTGAKVLSITNATTFVMDTNATASGSGIALYCYVEDAYTPIPGQYDQIAFETPNQATHFNLGGRNGGVNWFSMDLHDNGTGPLTFTKTGDGQWVMGELHFQTLKLASTPSRNDFTGRSTIYTGTLGVAQNGVFGAAGGESVNLIGGNLDLRNVNYTVNENLSMAGGRLRALVGNNAWTGNVSMDVGSTIEMGPTSTLNLRGSIVGKGGITKIGFGTLIFSGSNTFTGGVNVSEGTLQLDYSTNAGSKLADGAGVNLGGGRKGGIIDIVGGSSNTVELIAALNLGFGQNRIIRSDLGSNTIVRLNALENFRVAPGASLDIGGNNMSQTDRLNEPGGILGNWLTVNKSDWATNATNAVDGNIVALGTLGAVAPDYVTDIWNDGLANVNVTTSTGINNGLANTLRFGSPTATTTTLTGSNIIKSNGILFAPSANTASHTLVGGTIVPQDNGMGGNLMIHQNAPVGTLIINSTISNAPGSFSFSGTHFNGGVGTSVLLDSPASARNLSVGTAITGPSLDPGTAVALVDYVNGVITLNKTALAAINVPLTINGTNNCVGDLMAEGQVTRIRVKTGDLVAITVGHTITGPGVPGGATVTAKATDGTNPAFVIITISQTIQPPSPFVASINALSLVGRMYFNAQTNRFRLASAAQTTNLYVGMPVTGINIEPGTTISSIDFNAGDVFISQGRTAEVGIPITINSVVFTGDTMVAGVLNRVRVFGSSVNLKAIAIGQAISGGIIPASSTVTGITLDDPDSPTVATLSISINVTVPAIIIDYVLNPSSRNGVAKYGDGTLVLAGDNTYTGPTIIAGGKLIVPTITGSGVAGPLGVGNLGAGSLVIGGATFGYSGDSVRTDRGFTINEIGAIEVRRQGVVADFTGNLSGGVGASLGTVQKTGEGTLKISRIDGRVATTTSAATVGFGGATNIGGFEVNQGTLLLAYENLNSNDSSNRFAANIATLTMGGGALELVGLPNTILETIPGATPSDPPTVVQGPSENRTQQFLGQFTVNSGASQVTVSGRSGTTTTLNLQDVNNPIELVRQPGGTVHFVENPTDGAATMTLSLPSLYRGAVLPWATYKDTSLITRPGVNDFAAIESSDAGLINADSKDLYRIGSDVNEWSGSLINQTVTEGGGFAYSGTTPSALTRMYAVRFFEPQVGEVNVANTLELTGGALLVGDFVGNNAKSILGGSLTSSLFARNTRDLTPTEITQAGHRHQDTPTIADDDKLWEYDLLIHNYNAAGPFTIGSTIKDNNTGGILDGFTNVAEPVNLVHLGIGTTTLTGDNTYTGTTYLNGGVLFAPSASATAIPGGLGVTGGVSNITFNGGVLAIDSTFSRELGTNPSQVRFTGSGGFAAFGTGVVDVNFGGAADPVIWRGDTFVPGAGRLILSAEDALGTLRLLNPIDIGGTPRQIDVPNGFADVDAEFAANLSGDGGSLVKLGHGALKLTGVGTYTGGTLVAGGNVVGDGSSFGSSGLGVGTSDSNTATARIALTLTGGTLQSATKFGNTNSTGITELIASGNSTITPGVTIDRRLTVSPASGRSLTLNGPLTGTGSLTLTDGGTLLLHGTGAASFGQSAGAQGSAIDGGVIVRDGSLVVGSSTALGSSNVELGDTMRTFPLATVTRTTGGHSLLLQGGSFDPTGNGTPGASGGTGAFLFPERLTVDIDGKTYGQAHVGTKILVNGEDNNPERNGIYQITFFNGLPKVIGLKRADALDDAREALYGTRIQVTGDTDNDLTPHDDAGKTFYLVTDRPASLPAPDGLGRVLITHPIYWKEEGSVNPNLSLLADAAGISVANSMDINNTNGTGSVTLGGASGLTTGSSTFSGGIVNRSTARTVRLVSETSTDKGINFSGVFSESGGQLSLLKLGSGTVTLSASNTYTGTTNVNAGTLLVNGSTGTGALNVSNAGSTLGGIGFVGGNTVVNPGGIISPGDPSIDSGYGPLSFVGSLAFEAESTALLQIQSEVIYDRLLVGGTLTMDNDALIRVMLNYTPSNLTPITFSMLSFSNLIAQGSLADYLVLDEISGYQWVTNTFGLNGELVLAPTVIPAARFAIRDATVSETGATVIRVSVELDTSPSGGVQIPLTFNTGTATEGPFLDYSVDTGNLADPHVVVFNTGERSKAITVTINNDAISEVPSGKTAADSAEKAIIKLGTPVGANLGTPTSFTVNIIDDDSGFSASDLWTLRNPLPTNETLLGVATNGTAHVAVGASGAILRSTDGVAWTLVPLPITVRLNAVASDGSGFIAVGNGGRILTSPDGTTWTIRGTGNANLTDIIWTGSTYVAVGASGTTLSSTTGLGWTVKNVGVTVDLEGIASGPGVLIAVGASGSVFRSTDGGATWNTDTSGVSTGLRGIAFNGSLFVAVGDTGTVITSAGAGTWNTAASGTSATLNSVRSDGITFVATGAAGTILTSNSGTAGWTAQVSGTTAVLQMAGKIGSNWAAVGNGGVLLTSPDAATWTLRTTGPINNLNDVASNGTKYLAVGAAGSVLESANGITWTAQTSGLSAAAVLNSIVASTTTALAVGDSGAAIKTANSGTTWTNINSGSSAHLRGVAQRSTLYVAVGDSGTILSYNGTSWTTRSSGTVEHLRGVTSSASVFVAVGDNGTLLRSLDGITWTPITLTTSAALRDVVFTGTRFIVVGSGGTVLTSTDGLAWTPTTVSGQVDLFSVTSLTQSPNTYIIAVGANGGGAYSGDGGLTWHRRVITTATALAGVVGQPLTAGLTTNRFIAVGASGSILSTDTAKQPPSVVGFSILASTVGEGSGVVNAQVLCSPAPSKGPVTVTFTTSGTATKGSDYTIAPAASIVFNIGETTKNIVLTPLGDAVNELTNETAIVTINNVTGNGGLPADAPTKAPGLNVYTLTITNDYAPVAITTEPTSTIVAAGSNITLNSDGTGSAVLKQQWLKAGAAVAASATITGTTSKILGINNITVANAGKYQVKYSNPVTASKLSDANLTTPAVFDPVEIAVVERLASPQLKLAKINTPLVLTANVGGTATALSYQWFYQPDMAMASPISLADVKYSGANTKTLTIKKMDNGTGTTAVNEEGIYYCAVTLTAYGNVIGTLNSTDFNARVAALPDIIPTPTTIGILATGRVGTPFYAPTGFQIPRAGSDIHNTPVTYTAAPLPAGLTLNATTGIISGTPTAAGDFKTIKITATNPAGTTTVTACWIRIDPVPPTALGSFVGLAARNGAHDTAPPSGTFGLGARVEFTTLPNGTYSGKLTIGTIPYPFVAGKLNTSTANPTGTIVIPRANKTTVTLAFTINVATNTFTGTLTDTAGTANISGWRNIWSATNPASTRAGVHNFMALIPASLEGDSNNPGKYPQGDSYASATVTASTGSVVVAGKLSDGSVIATTAPLGPTGQFLIYTSLYTSPTIAALPAGAGYPGSLIGTATIGIVGNPHGIEATDALTWSKQPQKPGSTKVYQGGWSDYGPTPLSLSGDLYKAPIAGSIIMALNPTPGLDNASIEFFNNISSLSMPDTVINDPNLPSVRINSIATFVSPASNLATVKLTFTPGTGAITGSFILKHPAPALPQTISYFGLVIPDNTTPTTGGITPADLDGSGVGYYLMPAISTNPTGATKSGRVKILPK